MDDRQIHRRQFLIGLSASMGAALTPLAAKAAQVAISNEQVTSPLLLSAEQLEVVKIISDIIIPDTDTPGAAKADVHHFINKVVSYALDDKERADFLTGLTKAKTILGLSLQEQTELVRQWDNNRLNDEFFNGLKQSVIFGYYTSKIGATQELRFDPVPGPYKEIPFKDVGRAWALR